MQEYKAAHENACSCEQQSSLHGCVNDVSLFPPQRGVAILGVCAWGAGRRWNPVASDFRACRPRLPGLPCLPGRTALLCGNHTEAVWQPHKAVAVVQQHNCGCPTATRPLAVLQQHNCGCATGQESAGKHRIWAEPGRNSTVRAETLCGKSCGPQDASRMPGLPKGQRINQNQPKTMILRGKSIFGPNALR